MTSCLGVVTFRKWTRGSVMAAALTTTHAPVGKLTPMKQIDESRLEEDLEYRFGYLVEFMGFGEADVQVIHAAAPVLAPFVPAVVDAVYEKLFSYDSTKRHFVPRQDGFDGPVPENLESLEMDHEQITFRKNHLVRYLEGLVTRPYDAKLVSYLDMVGKIHTEKAGSEELFVPPVQMNALMGFVSDALVSTILGLGLESESETATVRAFNKLLWLQNDLINRHYAATPAVV